MANINSQEPAARVAPPESACPHVQPLASRAPCRKIVPPRKAISQRVRLEILGPLVVSSVTRPPMKPEVNPPNSAPKNTGTIQSSSGFLSPPAIFNRYGVLSTCRGATASTSAASMRLVAPEEPSPLPVMRNARKSTIPRIVPPRYGWTYGFAVRLKLRFFVRRAVVILILLLFSFLPDAHE